MTCCAQENLITFSQRAGNLLLTKKFDSRSKNTIKKTFFGCFRRILNFFERIHSQKVIFSWSIFYSSNYLYSRQIYDQKFYRQILVDDHEPFTDEGFLMFFELVIANRLNDLKGKNSEADSNTYNYWRSFASIQRHLASNLNSEINMKFWIK